MPSLNGSLTPTFVTARPVSLAVRLASAFALFCLISVQAERTFESRRGTLLGGQFDWGGRLLKSNGGVQGSLSLNGNQAKECKRRSEPNCETDGSSSNESWS